MRALVSQPLSKIRTLALKTNISSCEAPITAPTKPSSPTLLYRIRPTFFLACKCRLLPSPSTDSTVQNHMPASYPNLFYSTLPKYGTYGTSRWYPYQRLRWLIYRNDCLADPDKKPPPPAVPIVKLDVHCHIRAPADVIPSHAEKQQKIQFVLQPCAAVLLLLLLRFMSSFLCPSRAFHKVSRFRESLSSVCYIFRGTFMAMQPHGVL